MARKTGRKRRRPRGGLGGGRGTWSPGMQPHGPPEGYERPKRKEGESKERPEKEKPKSREDWLKWREGMSTYLGDKDWDDWWKKRRPHSYPKRPKAQK